MIVRHPETGFLVYAMIDNGLLDYFTMDGDIQMWTRVSN